MANNSENIVIAKRYAKALRASSGSVSQAKKNYESLCGLVGVVEENPDLFDVLTSPISSRDEIKSVFSEISKKYKFNDQLNSFLLLLADARRVSGLPEIKDKFKEIINDEEGVVTASVLTAKKLDSKSIDNIKGKLEKITGKKIEVNSKIDKSLIGGLKIKIGSQLFDDSISGKLEGLKTSLADC